MNNTEEKDPLVEWNRINKENAERGFASALFQSMSDTSPLVDKFSMWLLAGTGATSALLISQIKSVLPHLTESGFKVSLILLVGSAVCGFLAKYYSLRCEIQSQVQLKLIQSVAPVLEKHMQDENKITEYAKQRGLVLQTEIQFSKVIEEFSRPFPFWVKWLIARKISKTAGDRQAGYHVAIKEYMSQLRWSFFQACCFLFFILAAAWYASAI